MLARVRHIREPIIRQGNFGDTASSDAIRMFAQLDTLTDVQIQTLAAQLEQLGGTPVTSAIATIIGTAAVAVDGMRDARISRGLRDDYSHRKCGARHSSTPRCVER